MKVLCPIDFSKHSVSALRYASRVAEDLGAELHIMHVFRVAQVVESLKELKEELTKKHLASIEGLVNQDLASHSGETVKVVQYGIPDTEIIDYVKNNEIDLVVMGSQGNSTLQNRFMGSVAAAVVDKVKVPTMILPSEQIIEYAPSKVLLALDNLELEHEGSFRIPMRLADKWNKKIDVVHISAANDKSFPFDPFVGNFLKDHYGEIHLLEDNNVGYTLMDFVKKQDYSLMIMVNRTRGFWAKLFNKNHIAEEIYRCFVPLLIVPE